MDKRIVKEPGSENDVWWGPVNKPMSPDVSKRFVETALSRLGAISLHIESMDYRCDMLSMKN